MTNMDIRMGHSECDHEDSTKNYHLLNSKKHSKCNAFIEGEQY
jgi:hypothetical protein